MVHPLEYILILINRRAIDQSRSIRSFFFFSFFFYKRLSIEIFVKRKRRISEDHLHVRNLRYFSYYFHRDCRISRASLFMRQCLND